MKLLPPLVGPEATKFLEMLMDKIDKGQVEVTEGLFDLHIVIKD